MGVDSPGAICCRHLANGMERTFAWLGNYRRLSKDYEHLPQVSEAMVYAA